MYPDFSISEIDDAGTFRIQNLAPGTYRVAAVDVSDWSRKDEPGAIAGWLAAGVETTLAEKEAGRVAIEIRP